MKTDPAFNDDHVLEGLVLACALTGISIPHDRLLAMAKEMADADAESSVFALGHIIRGEAVPDELTEKIKSKLLLSESTG